MLLALLLAATPPVEECRGDPAFEKARAALVDAIAKRDLTALEAMTIDDVIVDDAGDTVGKKELRTYLVESEWERLEVLATGGCIKQEESRILPSFVRSVTDEEGIVAAPAEPLRAAPSPTARRIGTVRWEGVAQNYGDSGPDYWHVRLQSGRKGYVRASRIFSAYHSPYVVLARQGDRWMITSIRLIAAD